MKQIKILLVEDNPDDRLLIKRGIQKGLASSKVLEALNLMELEQHVAEGCFDITITDYNLGWTDGISVLKMVKQAWPDCPVIMMTVMDTEEVAMDAMKAGLDSYIVKSSSQFALMGEIVKTALEQREKTQALQAAEDRYQELFETVPIGLFRETSEGDLIDVNNTLVSILGYPSKEQLLETNAENLYLNPGDRTENLSKLTPENDLGTWEAQVKHFSGKTITLSVTAKVIYDIHGDVLFYEGYASDITERKRVEEALIRSEVLNETIVDSVYDGVIVVDRDKKILTWNKTMEEISGLTQNDVFGLPLVDVFLTDMSSTIQSALQKTLDGEITNIPDMIHHFPRSGKRVWLETTFSPLRTAENRLIGVVANIHDITLRKDNEKEREQLLAAEKKRSRELAALTTASTIISSNLEIQQVLDVVAEQMSSLLNVESCVIYSWDESKNEISRQVEHTAGRSFRGETRLPERVGDQHPEIVRVLKEVKVFQADVTSSTLSASFRKEMKEKGILTVLLIPLTHQERTIGLIKLEDSESLRTFDHQEIFLAEMLGNQASVALENARLFNETNESLQREQLLHQASREISSVLSLEKIVETTNRLITRITGGDFSGVLLIDPETENAVDIHFYNAPSDAPKIFPESDQGLIGEMVKKRKPWVLEDYSAHPSALPYWKAYGVKATMFLPLEASDSLLGFIAIFSTDPTKKFSPRDQEQGISIGRHASVAMHKAILYEQTRRRSEELSALYDIALATGSVLDSTTLLSRLQSNIEHFINPDSFGIFLYHEETNSFKIASAFTNQQPIKEVEGECYPLKPGGLISEVMLEHKPLLINDLSLGDAKNVLQTFNLPVKSWLGIPLISGDRLVGALSVQSFTANAFSENDQRFLESIAGQVSIALDNAHLYEELEDAYFQTVIALANAVDVRDAYTHDHSQRMAGYAQETGKLLGLGSKDLENLRWGALLHDIGKIGIPDEILLKPKELTKKEYQEIMRHPILGAAIIAPVKKLKQVAPIIRAHQERYDGTGYPDGLAGDQIPMTARILSVVDCYVAMTDDRVYRTAIRHEEAIQEIKGSANTQHDPVVVEAFLKAVENLHNKENPPSEIEIQDINIASPKE